jgi:putative RNase toxin 4 of polymorphic toxin system
MSNKDQLHSRMDATRPRPAPGTGASQDLIDFVRRLEEQQRSAPSPEAPPAVRGTADRGTDDVSERHIVIDEEDLERRLARPAAAPTHGRSQGRSPVPAGSPRSRGVPEKPGGLPPVARGPAGRRGPAPPTSPAPSPSPAEEASRGTADRSRGVRPVPFWPKALKQIREERFGASRKPLRLRLDPLGQQELWQIGEKRFGPPRGNPLFKGVRWFPLELPSIFDPRLLPPDELRSHIEWVRREMGGWSEDKFFALEMQIALLPPDSATYAVTFYAWAWELLSREQHERMRAIRQRIDALRLETIQREGEEPTVRTDRNPRSERGDPLGLTLRAPNPLAGLEPLEGSVLGSSSYALMLMFGADNDLALNVAALGSLIGDLAPAVAGGISLIKSQQAHAASSPASSPVNLPREASRGSNRAGFGAPELFSENVNLSGDTAHTGGIREIRAHRYPDGTLHVSISGEMRNPLPRVGPATPNFEKDLPRVGEIGLANYQIAHLWGPGLGDEARDGMMYAPREVNLAVQARVESVLRSLHRMASAQGGTVEVTAGATSYPRLAWHGHEILKEASYRFSVRFPDGTSSPTTEVRISVPPPGSSDPVTVE